MKYTVAEIAKLVSAEVIGDPDAVITAVCKIEEGVAGGLTFLANPKYTSHIYDTKATAAIVDVKFVPEREVPCTLIRVANPYLAFARLLDFYRESKLPRRGVSPHACIASSASIGINVYIGEFVSIGENAVVGDGCRIYPQVCLGDNVQIGKCTVLNAGVKVYEDCIVGENCILHAGCVIGADGFGFASQNDGEYFKIPQIGNVVVGDNVEIGANTCIDRAMMGSTRIGDNVKIDNLVQIAHNVVVGEGTAFAAQTGVAGSVKIGSHCVFAGQTGIAGHLTIEDRTVIGAQSGVGHSLKSGVYLGSPALPLHEARRLIVYNRQLPKMARQLKDLRQAQEQQEKTEF